MGDDAKRRYSAGLSGGGAGWDQPPPSGNEDETRAIAFMGLENLKGTDNWAWLCPAILTMSAIVSLTWLWQTEELVPERKGFVFMGILGCVFATIVICKRYRDAQHADLLIKYGQRTRFYHESTIKQLRGTDAFRTATSIALFVFIGALFGGIWAMPFSTTSKWMIAMMCIQTISSTFVYANQKRNVDTAETFMQTLEAQQIRS